MRLILSALALTLSGFAVFAENTVTFSTDDPLMQAATADARTTLPRFLSEVIGSDGVAVGNVAIKVEFPTEGGGPNDTEVIWIAPFSRTATGYSGTLANEPEAMGTLKLGDNVDFTEDQIADWSFFGDDGKLYGNYSTRVMLPQLSEEEAAPIREVLSEEPVPAFWSN